MNHPLSSWIGFGYKFKEPTWYGIHKGLDYMVRVGTPVFASMNGKCYPRTGVQGGKQVWQFSRQKAWRVRYMHLSKFFVEKDQYVRQGDLIGYSGNSGLFTTGPHLHVDILHNLIWVDPLKIFEQDYLKQLDNYMTKEELLKELDQRYASRDERFAVDTDTGESWIIDNYKKYKFGKVISDMGVLFHKLSARAMRPEEKDDAKFPVTKDRKDVL